MIGGVGCNRASGPNRPRDSLNHRVVVAAPSRLVRHSPIFSWAASGIRVGRRLKGRCIA